MKTLFAICLLICVIVVSNAKHAAKKHKRSTVAPNALTAKKAAELKKWKKLYRINQMKWSMISLKEWELDIKNKQKWIKFESKWLKPGKDVAKWKKAKAAAVKKMKQNTVAMWMKLNKEEYELSKETKKINREIRKLTGKPGAPAQFMDEELAELNDPAPKPHPKPKSKHHKKDKKNKKKKHQKMKNKSVKLTNKSAPVVHSTPPPPPAKGIVPDVTMGPLATMGPAHEHKNKGIMLENKSFPRPNGGMVPHVTQGPISINRHPMGMNQWNGMETQRWNTNNGMQNTRMGGNNINGGYEGGYGGANGMNGGYGSSQGGYNGGEGSYGGDGYDAEYMKDAPEELVNEAMEK